MARPEHPVSPSTCGPDCPPGRPATSASAPGLSHPSDQLNTHCLETCARETFVAPLVETGAETDFSVSPNAAHGALSTDHDMMHTSVRGTRQHPGRRRQKERDHDDARDG